MRLPLILLLFLVSKPSPTSALRLGLFEIMGIGYGNTPTLREHQ